MLVISLTSVRCNVDSLLFFSQNLLPFIPFHPVVLVFYIFVVVVSTCKTLRVKALFCYEVNALR